MRLSSIFHSYILLVLAFFVVDVRSEGGLRQLQGSGSIVDELLFTQYENGNGIRTTTVNKLTVTNPLGSPSVTSTPLPMPTNVGCVAGTNTCRITRSHDQQVAHITMQRQIGQSAQRCSADFRAVATPVANCYSNPLGINDLTATSITQTGDTYRMSTQRGVFRAGGQTTTWTSMMNDGQNGANYSTVITHSATEYLAFRYKSNTNNAAIKGSNSVGASNMRGGENIVRVVHNPVVGDRAFMSYSHNKGFQNFTYITSSGALSSISDVNNGGIESVVDFVISLDGQRVYAVRGNGQIDCISFVQNKVVRIRNAPSGSGRVNGIGLFPSVPPSPSATPTISNTRSATPTTSGTRTATATYTGSSSGSATYTVTHSTTTTATASPTTTLTAGSTPSNSPTPSETPTSTSSITGTGTPTTTSTATVSPTATLSPGASPSNTPTVSPTSSNSPTNSATPSNTASASFSSTPGPDIEAIVRAATSGNSSIGTIAGVVGGLIAVAVIGFFAYKAVEHRKNKARLNRLKAGNFGSDSYMTGWGGTSAGASDGQTVVYQVQMGRGGGGFGSGSAKGMSRGSSSAGLNGYRK